LTADTTGNANTAMGYIALNSDRTGNQNIGIGFGAGAAITAGTGNTIVGVGAGQLNGSTVTGIGSITGGSGYQDGTYNDVMLMYQGTQTFYQFPMAQIVVSGGAVTNVTITDGGTGLFVGAVLEISVDDAPPELQGGSGFNVPVTSVATPLSNTFIGRAAGQFNYNGGKNTFLGYYAGRNSSGSGNVIIGHTAGQFNNADNKLIINNNNGTPLIEGDFDPNGGSNGTVKVNGTFILTAAGPANSNDPGNAGQLAFDSNYFYVCVAPNTWKRVALSSW